MYGNAPRGEAKQLVTRRSARRTAIKPLQRVIANPDIHNQTHVASAAREALQAIKGRQVKR